MTDIEKCNLILSTLFPDQDTLQQRWWSSVNKAFDSTTPQEMFVSDPKRVVKYLLSQLNGDYS